MIGTETVDVCIVGAGHNALVAATLLARHSLRVLVVEERSEIGGACKTERPFARAPELATSTGAYLLGLMPPELMWRLGISLPFYKRDPHYFLPTTDRRYLLLGSDSEQMERQFRQFFSEEDWEAHLALQEELAQLREDVGPCWLAEPLSVEETAQRYVRPELRQVFLDLCSGPICDYLGRFSFRSELLQAMYATTDAFPGLCGGWETPGSGMNFLMHNMCRLPGSDGTWMIVQGGMGTVSKTLADAARAAGARIETNCAVQKIGTVGSQLEPSVDRVYLANGREVAARVVLVGADPFRMRSLVDAGAFPEEFHAQLDGYLKDGTTLKVNLALRELPTYTCLPEDRGQYQTTTHLLPEGPRVIDSLVKAFGDVQAGRLPECPPIEWYIHTTVDPSLRDSQGRHNSALFVQWVPHTLAEGPWSEAEDKYVQHLLTICDRFAPGTSELVDDVFTLTPPKIEQHFGITRGHIHHVDNSFGFADRLPYRQPIQGLYSCSAGCHPGGSVIGAAGHNAAECILDDLAW